MAASWVEPYRNRRRVRATNSSPAPRSRGRTSTGSAPSRNERPWSRVRTRWVRASRSSPDDAPFPTPSGSPHVGITPLQAHVSLDKAGGALWHTPPRVRHAAVRPARLLEAAAAGPADRSPGVGVAGRDVQEDRAWLLTIRCGSPALRSPSRASSFTTVRTPLEHTVALALSEGLTGAGRIGE